MGGDGLSAPKGAYALQGFALTGDVSGGNISHTVTMDNRFCSLITYVTLSNVQVASADADFRFTMAGSGGNQVPLVSHSGLSTAISATVSTVTINELWRPPPVLLPGGPDVGFFAVRVLNVDDDVVSLSMMIYLFDIDVRTKTPMGPLLWARGAS